MSSDQIRLTPKQKAFVEWYVKLLNGGQAAKRAGYSGDMLTLDVVASENLRKPYIRAEIDRRLKESIPSADVLLTRISQTALSDVTPYLTDDGMLDVQALADAGLGHLVVGVKPGKDGPEYTLAHPQTARKMLARYHRILGSLEVDLTTTSKLDRSSLDVLVAQVTAAARQGAQETDDTTEQSDIE